MKKLAERLRWRIAALVDKLRSQCWTELVMYGLGYKRNPWSPMDATCRSDANRCGTCYCGKLRKREDAAPAVFEGCVYCGQWDDQPHQSWCYRAGAR